MASQLPYPFPAAEIELLGRGLGIMNGLKGKAIFALLTVALVALLVFGTTEAFAAAARLFCVSSTAIFAVASIVGLATRLRA
jgi:hypothetical protein